MQIVYAFMCHIIRGESSVMKFVHNPYNAVTGSYFTQHKPLVEG